MKPILVSSGEPAGIGPDLCLDLVNSALPIVVLGDPTILQARALALGKKLKIKEYRNAEDDMPQLGELYVWPIHCPVSVCPGVLNPAAADYVLELLTTGAHACLQQHAAALVTAPVHKANINQSGIAFTGHTEFFSDLTASETVMLLASDALRVSLVTTHLPLSAVPAAITQDRLHRHLQILYSSLQCDFGIAQPRLKILGLNPHAGEDGYLGGEERDVIQPVMTEWQQRGCNVQGPFSADTAFLDIENWDVIVAMYHDQGLPVLKFASFGHAVNISCGLPFIRTSVDHGTALSLAGTGRASSQSLLAAVTMAANMARKRD
jgi:4-hydroxythreonine-4-phosphate dehydrogenase